jgi:hypothetical protein
MGASSVREVRETDVLRFLLLREGLPERAIQVEETPSSRTAENFINTRDVVARALAARADDGRPARRPVVALVTHPPLLSRLQATGQNLWPGEWDTARFKTHDVDLRTLTEDALIELTAYVAGYPAKYAERHASLPTGSELKGTRDQQGRPFAASDAAHVQRVRDALEAFLDAVNAEFDPAQNRMVAAGRAPTETADVLPEPGLPGAADVSAAGVAVMTFGAERLALSVPAFFGGLTSRLSQVSRLASRLPEVLRLRSATSPETEPALLQPALPTATVPAADALGNLLSETLGGGYLPRSPNLPQGGQLLMVDARGAAVDAAGDLKLDAAVAYTLLQRLQSAAQLVQQGETVHVVLTLDSGEIRLSPYKTQALFAEMLRHHPELPGDLYLSPNFKFETLNLAETGTAGLRNRVASAEGMNVQVITNVAGLEWWQAQGLASVTFRVARLVAGELARVEVDVVLSGEAAEWLRGLARERGIALEGQPAAGELRFKAVETLSPLKRLEDEQQKVTLFNIQA